MARLIWVVVNGKGEYKGQGQRLQISSQLAFSPKMQKRFGFDIDDDTVTEEEKKTALTAQPQSQSANTAAVESSREITDPLNLSSVNTEVDNTEFINAITNGAVQPVAIAEADKAAAKKLLEDAVKNKIVKYTPNKGYDYNGALLATSKAAAIQTICRNTNLQTELANALNQ